MVDDALRLSPENDEGHYLRGRILSGLGREKEARAEFALVQSSKTKRLSKEIEAHENMSIPNPELKKEPE